MNSKVSEAPMISLEMRTGATGKVRGTQKALSATRAAPEPPSRRSTNAGRWGGSEGSVEVGGYLDHCFAESTDFAALHGNKVDVHSVQSAPPHVAKHAVVANGVPMEMTGMPVGTRMDHG